MKVLFTSALAVLLGCAAAYADDTLLSDRNGDGAVSYLAFGDSITFGIGDTATPQIGYPGRLQALIGIAVMNRGVPGEQLADGGAARFPAEVIGRSTDLVGILEGANDAEHGLDPSEYARLMQRLINVARAEGREPVLLTIPTPCCNHAAFAPFTIAYSAKIRELAAVNDAATADLEAAWHSTCVDKQSCELFNVPEGLHPNAAGYEVIAQTVAAALYGIDIFSSDGAAQLEEALGKPAGTVIVKPAAEGQ